MPFLNLGILAHVDAGKTSLTERLLYDTGAITELGAVDAGTTRTDSMDLERQRGITIRTNVASFVRRGVQVNLIDTPGHSDFIAEVERSLGVLDAAVLVVSAVEGVQPQTVVLWRALRRLGVSTVVFVNKIDRQGSDVGRVVGELKHRLAGPEAASVLLLSDTEVEGTADARAWPRALDSDPALEVLTRHDDALLAAAVDGRPWSRPRLTRLTRRLVRAGAVVPTLAGSALTGAGVTHLLDTVVDVVPWARRLGDDTSALVFKIDQDAGTKRFWARIFAGAVGVRERVGAGSRPKRITSMWRTTPAGPEPAAEAVAGEVISFQGPTQLRIGDWIGSTLPGRTARAFAAPALESVVEPVDPAQRGALHSALTELADADPLIGLRVDPDRAALAVTLFGEVQKEVIASLLAEQFHVHARFSPTTVVHVERVLGAGEAHAVVGDGTTPYLATLGFRVEPAPVGSGLRRELDVELGSMPPAFFAASWEGVETGLAQGPHGWAMPDATVTMTRSGYLPRQSHSHQRFNKGMSSVGADFRNLAPVLVHAALTEAGTVVCEPIERFTLEVPIDALGLVTPALLGTEGQLTGTAQLGSQMELSGFIPTRRVAGLARQLPDLARGEAIFTSEVDHYRPVEGPPPVRPRTGPDPADRDTWFKERPR